MSTPSSFEELYWRELGAALRAMVAPGVMLAAACGAALTLTGASAPVAAPTDASCQSCQIRLLSPRKLQAPAI
jgi:hypothetical protein